MTTRNQSGIEENIISTSRKTRENRILRANNNSDITNIIECLPCAVLFGEL